jgi:hypothetical protein
MPPDRVLQEAQNEILSFLDDIKDELKRKIIPRATFKSIPVGSVKERYGIPHSYNNTKRRSDFISTLNTDIDVMFCFESIKASSSGLRNMLVIKPIVPEGIGFLGYAQLTSLEPDCVISSKDIIKQAKIAVGCTQIKNHPGIPRCFGRCKEVPELQFITKTPAIKIICTGNIFEADVTLCIKCFEWPSLSDWPERQRCWPSQEDVHRIKLRGCHLVPKPAPSDKEKTSWRFSFSLAEVELSKLVPNTARKCFLALKIILKDHLQPVAQFTSYDLKTVFLNTLEKTPVNFWVDENIEKCFLMLLMELRDVFNSGQCLHYWFSSVNLFSKFNNPKQVRSFLYKLERIAENPAPFIFDDGCCCIFPCCVRVHLYDWPERRSTSIQQNDEVDVCANEHVNEVLDALEA